jgi:hypothetical protein
MEAAWNMMNKIMGNPRISQAKKMMYWRMLPAEAWPRNWRERP